MKIFDIELKGTNLIEASAGTGKTYSIATLVLRYILEKGFSIKNILIVTFTIAATFELKERIRKFIKESYDYLTNNYYGNLTEELKVYLNKFDKEIFLDRLKLALSEFDEASIFTIHGFCYRTLIENAFESKINFDLEFVKDESDLIIEAIYDFWRDFVIDLPEYFHENINPEKFFSDLFNISSTFQNKNFVLIKPKIEEKYLFSLINSSKIKEKIKKFKLLKSQLLKEWNIRKKEFMDILKQHNKRIRKFQDYENCLDEYLNSEKIKGDEKLEKFIEIKDDNFFISLKKLHEIGNEISKNFEEILKYIKAYFLNTFNERMGKIKSFKGLIGFNDLVLKLYRILIIEKNSQLKEIISDKYHVAFIDEFQDTDLYQYEIFKKIFSQKDIFYIGDPKQSIYSFRGADIYTYLRAKKEVKKIYSLDKSYRFSPGYLENINFIFNRKKSFFDENIKYKNISCGGFKFVIQDAPSFTIKFINDNNIKVQSISEKIIKDMANEIINLLENEIYLKDKNNKLNKVDGSHIAILVRTNKEAELVKKEFLKFNIPSIIYSGKSVFKTQECLDILTILKAVLNPTNVFGVKSALITDIFNISFNEINEINLDDKKIENYRNIFKKYQDIFYKSGIYNMFQEIFIDFNTKKYLLSRPDGERKITNYYHIIELCNTALFKEVNGLESLIKWIEDKIVANSSQSEEYEIRLDTDEKAVKIITVHRCKGLEFPIVFIPFFWKSVEVKNLPFFVYKNYLSFNNDENDKEMSFKEKFSEDLRLFYVAITRGMTKCYLYFLSSYGRSKSPSQSVYNYIFNMIPDNIFDFKEFKEDLSEDKKVQNLLHFPDAEIVYNLNTEDKIYTKKKDNYEEKLVLKEFKREIKNSYLISSFTSLISNKEMDIDLIEFYESITFDVNVEDKIFEFPTGFKTGLFFHSLLEELDFRETEDSIKRKIIEKLDGFGFDKKEWFEPVYKNIIQLLNVDLLNNIKLKDIPLEETFREMEFYFYDEMDSLLKTIEKIFEIDNQIEFVEKMKEIRKEKIASFFNGFIDLVFRKNNKFYIVDYKTNFLGASFKNYEYNFLKDEIIKENYFLQMGIYLVAIIKFLKSIGVKDIPSAFGGVIYIFIRGIGEKGKGVYTYIPSSKALNFIN